MALAEQSYPLADVVDRIREAAVQCSGVPHLAGVKAEAPRDPSHGDLATNAAMVLCKDAKKSPKVLAEEIAMRLRGDPMVAAVGIAGPGFINLTLKPEVWTQSLRSALAAGEDYGRSDAAAGRTVNLEYVSANPTGPMHIGHVRGAVFGDALANLLEFTGHDVTREYYVNDGGAQIDKLCLSVLHRYREALGHDVGPIPAGQYPGDYLKPIGSFLAAKHGDALLTMDEPKRNQIIRDAAIGAMMARIKSDLASLGISHDNFFSERSLTDGGDTIAAAIADLRAKGHVYEGRLPAPKSDAAADDWEDREQVLFRSTAFGDDVDRALQKSDGGYTYFAADIAYHRTKIQRGFDEIVDVWGSDHGGYIRRMKAAVAAFDGPELDVKLIQLVRLMRDGEQIRMSKRSGDIVTLKEVVDEVGSDAVRFDMLYRTNDGALDFDLAKVIATSKDNPVFYVQYGHARTCSIARNARDAMPHIWQSLDRLADVRLELLTDPGEVALMKRIAFYPRAVEAAAIAHEPHRIAHYLHETVAAFHSHWTRGNQEPELRFILPENQELSAARLMLVNGVAGVLASGLKILGVSAPREMSLEMADEAELSGPNP